MSGIPKYIADLIEKGENQTLDFKYEISDSRKIAKTLSAFSNTEGGKLLIGVKDNGKIAGIRTNEEVFMIDSAAKLFCKPKINYSVKPWNINGKQILEVTIKAGKNKPYYAKDYDNKWKAYVRINDQNFKANIVQLKYWKQKNKRIQIHYSRKEQLLLQYLKDFGSITLDKYQKLAEISRKNAENTLVDFLILNIIEIKMDEHNVSFILKNEE